MRKIREVLRLKFDAVQRSDEKIAQAVGIGETTVRQYLSRAKAAGLTWPLPEDLCDKKLEEILYPPIQKQCFAEYDLPNFEYIHKELKRKGVTLSLLWEEYKGSHSNYYSYSQYCQLYKEWEAIGDTWMIQTHKAGESTFIDWAGLTVSIYNPVDGSIAFEAQIFVSALGASSYTFARAMRSQKVLDWCSAHNHMNAFYEGISDYWHPDNLKSGVTKSLYNFQPD